MNTSQYLVITNQDANGRRFRPSDWVDRLASSAGEFENGRIRYDGRVSPCKRCEDRICLKVDLSLQDDKPELLDFFRNFMRTNQLQNHNQQCPELSDSADLAQKPTISVLPTVVQARSAEVPAAA